MPADRKERHVRAERCRQFAQPPGRGARSPTTGPIRPARPRRRRSPHPGRPAAGIRFVTRTRPRGSPAPPAASQTTRRGFPDEVPFVERNARSRARNRQPRVRLGKSQRVVQRQRLEDRPEPRGTPSGRRRPPRRLRLILACARRFMASPRLARRCARRPA